MYHHTLRHAGISPAFVRESFQPGWPFVAGGGEEDSQESASSGGMGRGQLRVGLDGRDEGGKEEEETNARGALARGGRKAMLAQVAACVGVGVIPNPSLHAL